MYFLPVFTCRLTERKCIFTHACALATPPNFKMAELSQKADSSSSNSKIPCRSQRAVHSVIESIGTQLDKILRQNNERADAERQRYMQRFKEVSVNVTVFETSQ